MTPESTRSHLAEDHHLKKDHHTQTSEPCTGKTVKVVGEMRMLNLTILGITESRWTGSGRSTSSALQLF
ncbi:hypothetical protein DPMN_108576 [Dreissena polymorpha]|uniref:Uncharacterized protein n=1 Tax=Dreissena polymorpha TaxID=45954 RepID=A0A9D4QL54_DREPO|nr:hypothetical protein DPMN_108576 [Dreissena polymorpha]